MLPVPDTVAEELGSYLKSCSGKFEIALQKTLRARSAHTLSGHGWLAASNPNEKFCGLLCLDISTHMTAS